MDTNETRLYGQSWEDTLQYNWLELFIQLEVMLPENRKHRSFYTSPIIKYSKNHLQCNGKDETWILEMQWDNILEVTLLEITCW